MERAIMIAVARADLIVCQARASPAWWVAVAALIAPIIIHRIRGHHRGMG